MVLPSLSARNLRKNYLPRTSGTKHESVRNSGSSARRIGSRPTHLYCNGTTPRSTTRCPKKPSRHRRSEQYCWFVLRSRYLPLEINENETCLSHTPLCPWHLFSSRDDCLALPNEGCPFQSLSPSRSLLPEASAAGREKSEPDRADSTVDSNVTPRLPLVSQSSLSSSSS